MELQRRCDELEARLASTQRHFESFVEAVSRERASWSAQREALAASAVSLERRLANAQDQHASDRRRIAELQAESHRLWVLIRAEAGLRHLVADQLARKMQGRPEPLIDRLRRTQLWHYTARPRKAIRRMQARLDPRPSRSRPS